MPNLVLNKIQCNDIIAKLNNTISDPSIKLYSCNSVAPFRVKFS